MSNSSLPGRVGRIRRSASTIIPSIVGGATATVPVSAPATAITTIDGSAGTPPVYYVLAIVNDHALVQVHPHTGAVSFKHASVVGTYHATIHAKNLKGKASQALTINVT